MRPIVPIKVCYGSRNIETYALLDSGANCDAMLPSIAYKLGMNIKKRVRAVNTFGGRTVAERESVDCEVKSLTSDICVKVEEALVSDILTTSGTSHQCMKILKG